MVDLDKVIENLNDLVKNKYEFLTEIKLLTSKQTEVIEENDIEMLTILIDEKQERIDFIRDIDTRFEAIVDDIKTLYDIKTLDELEVENASVSILKENINKVMKLLASIVDIEKINKEKITINKKNLENRINNAQTGKKAIKQYGGVSGYTDAYFIDKKIK